MQTRVKTFKGATALEVEQEINAWAEANNVRILNASITATVATDPIVRMTHHSGCIIVVVYES